MTGVALPLVNKKRVEYKSTLNLYNILTWYTGKQSANLCTYPTTW